MVVGQRNCKIFDVVLLNTVYKDFYCQILRELGRLFY